MKDINIEQSEAVKKYLDYLDKARRINKKTRFQIHEKLLTKGVAESFGVTEEEMKQLDVMLKKDTSTYPSPEEIENGLAVDTYTMEKKNYNKQVIQTVSNDGTAIECEV